MSLIYGSAKPVLYLLMIPMTSKRYTERSPLTRIVSFRRSTRVFVLTWSLLGFLSFETVAQLQLAPAPRKKTTGNAGQHTGARTKSTTPLSLPFWDDFSFTPTNNPDDTTSNFPLDSLWQSNDTTLQTSKSVWINNDLAINAPSINVASFDGLNAEGLPYSDDVLSNGFRDYLISQPINLSEVDVSERNTVFLSFFFQWQGNGEPPDPSDYLQVAFWNKDTEQWDAMMTIRPKASLKRDEFRDTIIQVVGDKYFGDNFQFRFQNYGRGSGPYDNWNVDYVYLNKNRSLNSNSFPERAMASSVSPLFGKYHAMPLQHFNMKKKIMDTLQFDVQNLKGAQTDISIGFSTTGIFTNYVDGVEVTKTKVISALDNVKGIAGGLMDAFERVRTEMPHMPDTLDTDQFNPDADSIKMKLLFKVSGDNGDSGAPAFLPVTFYSNDTVSAEYVLKDYYAYDDGSAEYSATLTQSGNKLAYAFDKIGNDPDTLIGFYIYFPSYGLTGNRIVDFYIYGDNGGIPDDASPLYTILSKTVERKGINEFQRISIVEDVVVSGRFYVGYSSPSVRIGLDKSNNSSDRMFVYVNGTWGADENFTGSLMIRPIFGKGSGSDPVSGIPPEKTRVLLYPNPNKGAFYLGNEHQILQVITMTGQSISFETEDYGDDQQKVTLHQTTPGMYILKLRKGNSLTTEKIIVY